MPQLLGAERREDGQRQVRLGRPQLLPIHHGPVPMAAKQLPAGPRGIDRVALLGRVRHREDGEEGAAGRAVVRRPGSRAFRGGGSRVTRVAARRTERRPLQA